MSATGTALYRGMDRAALDRAYNNAAAVARSPEIVADWQKRSAAFRAAHPAHLDLRYGPAERNRIDFFSAGRGAPVLAYIHGGYWQMRAKEDFAMIAEGPLAHGISVAMIGYTLAPEASLDKIVAEIRAAVGWLVGELPRLGGDADRLFLAGWSAGGHLTATAVDHPAIRGAIAISGIFDLEPIRLCYLNDKLRLDEAAARRNSPALNLPAKAAPLAIVVGGAELPELRRQSRDYAEIWSGSGLPGAFTEIAGKDHFSVLEELARPEGTLAQLARRLVFEGKAA